MFGLIGICVSNPLVAHHGLDEYDTRTVIQLKGQVVGFKLQDPHSLLYVDVTNADGSITHWAVEGGAASGIAKSGVTKTKLSSNPRIIVHAYGSRNNTCKQDCNASGLDFIFE
jgi:hypothetical protein